MRLLYLNGADAGRDSATTRQLTEAEPSIELTTVSSSPDAFARIREAGDFDALVTSPAVARSETLALIVSLRRDRVPVVIVPVVTETQQEFATAAIAAGADDVLVQLGGTLLNPTETLSRLLSSERRPKSRRRLRVIYAGGDELVWTLLEQLPFVQASRATLEPGSGHPVRMPDSAEPADACDVVVVDILDDVPQQRQVARAIRARADAMPILVLATPTLSDDDREALDLRDGELIAKTGLYRRPLVTALERLNAQLGNAASPLSVGGQIANGTPVAKGHDAPVPEPAVPEAPTADDRALFEGRLAEAERQAARVTELESALASARAELERATARLASSEEDAATVRGHLEDALEATRAELRDAIARHTEERTSLAESVARLQQEARSIDEAHRVERSRYENAAESLEDRLRSAAAAAARSEYEETVRAGKAELQRAEARHAEDRAEWEAARAELGERLKALESAGERRDELTRDLESAQRDLHTTRADLESARAETGSVRAALERERDDLRHERDQAQAALETVRLDAAQAGAERDAAQAEREHAVAERDEARAARELAETARDEARAELDVLHGDLEGMRADADTKRHAIEAARADAEAVRANHEKARAELEPALNAARAERDTLRSELAEARHAADEAVGARDAIAGDRDEARRDLDSLRAEHDAERAGWADRRSAFEAERTTWQTARQVLEALVAETDAAAARTRDELEAALEASRAELDAEREASEAARAAIERVQQELQAAIDDARAETDRVRAELDQAVRDRDARTAEVAGHAAALEAARAAALEQHRRFIRRGPFGHALTTRSARLIECNDAFARLFGYPNARDLMRDQAGRPFTPLADRDALDARLLGHDRALESCLERADGQPVRVIESATTVTDPERGELIERVLIDLSEYSLLEDQLQRARRIERVGALTTEMAPDIESTLVALADAARRARAGRDSQADLDATIAGADRAAGLVRQLLAFSRRQQREPESLHLDALLTRSAAILRELVGPDITLDVRPGQTEPVPVGADDLTQLLTALTVQARDLLPLGGAVRIATDAGQAGTDEAGIFNRFVVLSVTALGYGVAAPERSTSLDAMAERCGGTLDLHHTAGREAGFALSFARCARSSSAGGSR